MAVRIEGIHRPGNHCGSTSLRTLSTHYGWDFDEPTCFGLAAGLGFAYFELPITPHRGFFGRPLWLETAFFENLGIAIDHREGDSWDEAWDHIRSEIDANNPVMVFADIYYLDYYGSDTHFSPHSLLCIGYEDDRAILADSEFEPPQSLPLDRLHEAMTSAHVMPIDNRHLVVTDPSMTIPYEEAALEAITETASYMLEPTSTSRSLGPGTHGIQGIRRFAEDLPDWPSVEDPFWTVRFAYQNIERRGTGGGAFRRMYAAFLESAAEHIEAVPESAATEMAAVADDWTTVATILYRASERPTLPEMEPDLSEAADMIATIADREAAIYESLRDSR